MKPQNNFFFIKTLQKKKLSENVMTNNSVVNIDNDLPLLIASNQSLQKINPNQQQTLVKH